MSRSRSNDAEQNRQERPREATPGRSRRRQRVALKKTLPPPKDLEDVEARLAVIECVENRLMIVEFNRELAPTPTERLEEYLKKERSRTL